MSVLLLPRLVFSGFTDWNPNTVNNSNKIYNETTAEPIPQPGVPWDQFVAWLLKSNGATDPAALQPNGSWNVYGDHGATLMSESGAGATITGITLDSGAVTSDVLLGTGVQIAGLLYMDSPQPAPARLVDLEPYGPFSSQIVYENVAIGNTTVGVTGRGACRMFSRWPNFARNLGALPIAGGMGVIWQTSVHNADLKWAGVDQSPALAALKSAAQSAGNQGIVVQFASYRTLYYQTVTYQGRAIRTGGDLIWAYENGYKGPNPARSVLLGTVGIWGAGELASAPTERLLAPGAPVGESHNVRSMVRLDAHPEAALAGQATQVPLGPATAIVDPLRNVVSVNFLATFPEQNITLEKADLGTFLLKAVAPDGTAIQIGQAFTRKLYGKDAYEASGGIAEFPFQAEQRDAIANGRLQLLQQGSTNGPALLESEFVAETDQRGTYIDEGETGDIDIHVYQSGALPTTNVQLLAAQYDTGGKLITDPSARIVAFAGPSSSGVLSVTNGVAKLKLQPLQSGICYVFFFPFTGTTPPQPPTIGFTSTSDFFEVIRVLPFDDQLEKSTLDSQLTWPFVYNKVFNTYDLIYPVMSLVRDLHNKNVVDAMAEQLKFAISLETFQSTLYMPITRELSAGKRKLLQRYVNLLPNAAASSPSPIT